MTTLNRSEAVDQQLRANAALFHLTDLKSAADEYVKDKREEINQNAKSYHAKYQHALAKDFSMISELLKEPRTPTSTADGAL